MVRFVGGPDGDYEIKIPLHDLSQTPFVCSGSGPWAHWLQEGDPSRRTFRYAGNCADIPGPHLTQHD